MKILITGANGYIGKSLHNALKNKHNVVALTREECDLVNPSLVNSYFLDKWFDVVLHCAVKGGSRLQKDEWDVMDVNISMYYNLLANKHCFNKFIHFGSGAEIITNKEPYGYSKDVIRKSMLIKDNFYNLRIFAVFDENELNTRFIKANIKRYINKEPIIVYQDMQMDFIYMKDLVTLVEYYILNNNLPKEINCNYDDLFSLVDIANIINNLDEYNVNIEITKTGPNKLYMGSFDDLGIKFIGLEQGIKEVYNKLKNEY